MDRLDVVERLIGLIAIILGLAGGPAGFVLGRRQRNADAGKTEADAGQLVSAARRIDAETLQIIRGVYKNTIDDLNGRMDEMEAEQKELKAENASLRAKVGELEEEVKKRDRKIEGLERQIGALEKRQNGHDKSVTE